MRASGPKSYTEQNSELALSETRIAEKNQKRADIKGRHNNNEKRNKDTFDLA